MGKPGPKTTDSDSSWVSDLRPWAGPTPGMSCWVRLRGSLPAVLSSRGQSPSGTGYLPSCLEAGGWTPWPLQVPFFPGPLQLPSLVSSKHAFSGEKWIRGSGFPGESVNDFTFQFGESELHERKCPADCQKEAFQQQHAIYLDSS